MALLDVLLPPSCAGCGRYGSLLCAACRATFRSASPAAAVFVQADPGIVTGEALTLAVAAFRYEGPLRRTLARLKYGGAPRLADPLARAAAPALRHLLELSGPAPLVPVPVHRQRLRQRGYNQARLLADALAASVRPSRGRLPRSRTGHHPPARPGPGQAAPEPAGGLQACGRAPVRPHRSSSWTTS